MTSPATHKATRKYLHQYAESEVDRLQRALQDGCSIGHYQHSLLIPCFDESTAFCQRLTDQLLADNSVLAIVVINRPDNRPTNEHNQQLTLWLKQRLPLQWQRDNLCLLGNERWGLLVVDRETQPIPHKQGVGLARKIGTDLACLLHSLGLVNSRWIHSTDADAFLPSNYFSLSDSVVSGSALSYAFQHKDYGCNTSLATQLYQRTLEHYRNGLRQAGSPYGFYTLGSTLAVNWQSYAQVRGFPKRSGGEDFYLLNKLAKLGPIIEIDEACIELEPRLSQRVPFGTGPATLKIEKLLSGVEESACRENHKNTANHARYCISSYHPQIFAELTHWLALAKQSDYQAVPLQQLLQSAGSTPLQTALAHVGVEDLWNHLQWHSGEAQFHSWFDGFRTLKLVHFLQTHYFPSQPIVLTYDAIKRHKKARAGAGLLKS